MSDRAAPETVFALLPIVPVRAGLPEALAGRVRGVALARWLALSEALPPSLTAHESVPMAGEEPLRGYAGFALREAGSAWRSRRQALERVGGRGVWLMDGAAWPPVEEPGGGLWRGWSAVRRPRAVVRSSGVCLRGRWHDDGPLFSREVPRVQLERLVVHARLRATESPGRRAALFRGWARSAPAAALGLLEQVEAGALPPIAGLEGPDVVRPLLASGEALLRRGAARWLGRRTGRPAPGGRGR